MDRIIFEDFYTEMSENAFVVELSNITDVSELFNELSYKLIFPNYFGYNWNALSDCLRDLSWIKNKEIVIIHKSLPSLDEHEFSIYIDLLYNAVLDWNHDEQHLLKIVFPISSATVIGNYLQSLY